MRVEERNVFKEVITTLGGEVGSGFFLPRRDGKIYRF
jgi:hypothetical protein